MRNVSFGATLLLFISILGIIHSATIPTIWPLPQQFTFSTKPDSPKAIFPTYKSNLIWSVSAPDQDTEEFVKQAVSRYQKFIFYNQAVKEEDLSSLCGQKESRFLCVAGIHITVDESLSSNKEFYTIDIQRGDDTIQIKVASIWSVSHALETLSQLIQLEQIEIEGVEKQLYGTGEFRAPVVVNDYPRFPWRGLLIDASRHFLDIPTVKHIVDGLSYIKMNVLHWHLIDAIAFPLMVPELPELANKGSWRPEYTYSPEQVKDVIQYAKQRGVNVILEADVPGHAGAWGFGIPEMTAKCPVAAQNLNRVVMHPGREITYQVIDSIIRYFHELDPEQVHQHYGGDEVWLDCWKEDSSVMEWLQSMKFTTVEEGLYYFEHRLQRIYQKYNKTMVCWEELFSNYNLTKMALDRNSTIVQAWRIPQRIVSIVKEGYHALLSAGYYLDKQQPPINFNKTQKHYAFVDTWKDFYMNEPYKYFEQAQSYPITREQKELVLGGEAAIWGEQVDTMNFDSRVFPRVLAVAERLWAEDSRIPREPTREVAQRLEHHRCNMVRRGIRAGPIMPSYCDAVYNF